MGREEIRVATDARGQQGSDVTIHHGSARDVTLETYLAENKRALERYAYVLTLDTFKAQDLLQATLLQIFRRWDTHVSRAQNPDAYVRRMLTNQFLANRRLRSAGELVGVDPRHESQAVNDTDALVERDRLRRLLLQLTPRARTVLALRYYEDLKDNEIAKMVGVRPATVRSIASRALAQMRALIAEQEHDHEV